jgi:hypothetical protein
MQRNFRKAAGECAEGVSEIDKLEGDPFRFKSLGYLEGTPFTCV